MACSPEVVAMDCEMVGLEPLGESGLARCSLVNVQGTVLYDKFIRPEGAITDYRTQFSGITPQHMATATPFAQAKQEVSAEIPPTLFSLVPDWDRCCRANPWHLPVCPGPRFWKLLSI